MAEKVRQNKVSKLLQKELGEIFRSESKNLFSGMFISVTVVRISPDLSFAKVYLSFMAVKDVEKGLDIVKSKAREIRKRLALATKGQLRVVPEVNFYIDDSLDYAEKIDNILKSI
jgi:ribosome-binding factor A